MSNSTPYELRFKVLEMARDLCMDQYHQNYNVFWQLHQQIENIIDREALSKEKVLVLRDMLDDLVDATPSMPTPDQINAKARELYEFVSTK